jgi:Dyp-type peroxidase family
MPEFRAVERSFGGNSVSLSIGAATIATTREPANEPVLAIDEIQGNVLVGFNKRHQAVLCLQIADTADAVDDFRRWLLSFKRQVTYMSTVLKAQAPARLASADREPALSPVHREPTAHHAGEHPSREDHATDVWVQIAFSHRCLQRLDSTIVDSATARPGEVRFADDAFRAGLAKRSGLLSDPMAPNVPGNPKQWKVGGFHPQRRADVFILLAHDALRAVRAEIKAIRGTLVAHGRPARLVYQEIGERLDKQTPEHFGYFADGASQPGIRGQVPGLPGGVLTLSRNPADQAHQGYPGQQLVWPGSFVFGYVAQYQGETASQPADNAQVFAVDSRVPDWAVNGSYLVFRRLHQDVQAFHDFLRDKARDLGVAPEYLAAKLLGRWPTGAPIVRAPLAESRQPMTPCTINHFNYQAASPRLPEPAKGSDACGDTDPLSGHPFEPADKDDLGTVCPFVAHIRKVYPRDDLALDANGQPDEAIRRRFVERRRILRRGLRYGPFWHPTIHEPVPANKERGVLFLAYQASIQDQFEWLVTVLANNPYQPGPATAALRGWDPIIGQNKAEGRARHFPIPYQIDGVDQPTRTLCTAREWVIPTGGEYFFVPARAGLDHLASTPTEARSMDARVGPRTSIASVGPR